MKPNARNIAGEAVAGLLWMHLDIPKDASRAELEGYASELIDDIHATFQQDVIERKIAALQVKKLCRPLNLAAVPILAERSIAVVRSISGQLRHRVA